MFSAIIELTSFTQWALFPLVLFFFVFVMMLFWVFRKGSATFYQSLSELPLEDNK